ncbi:hypothetical protein K435DRAFT_872987 [Dendrothele bispora CBS 962.96]|uniref:Phosphatidylglycerol/phosphatidylinositol transfer protein n=1 Tax=Dendrothele bispora (strain CBS 962.96) TaxID=1314807 RepID=A0A4S8L098_DENBC|nr:hypothetical protein K435DRAFT_872987 [Dendrothele bispora CBS 962.96]
MKLSLISTVVACSLGALAQRANVGSPTVGTAIQAGSNMTIRVDRPDTLSGSKEVGIVLGLVFCPDPEFPCRPAEDGMGFVLYDGPFNPQFSTPSGSLPPHENFVVSIPNTTAKGTAQLQFLHVSLIGASLAPFLETSSVNVTIV